MEPDHSANIVKFLEAYPEAEIVGNAKTFQMISNFYDLELEGKKVTVANNGTLSLGVHELTFVFAPMVHWPEVMVTYDSKDKVLFSADGFGKFGALDVDEAWACEARRYYFAIVIMNNDVLGMVRQWQTIFYDCHYSQTTLDRSTDVPALAKAFGAEGFAACTMNDLKAALDTAERAAGPVLIDCRIDMDEKVLPMIPPGRSVKDMIVKG